MKTKFTKIFYSFVFILTMNRLSAQEGFEPDTTDTLPINDYLIPMLVIGIAIGFHLLRKRTAIVKQFILLKSKPRNLRGFFQYIKYLQPPFYLFKNSKHLNHYILILNHKFNRITYYKKSSNSFSIFFRFDTCYRKQKTCNLE